MSLLPGLTYASPNTPLYAIHTDNPVYDTVTANSIILDGGVLETTSSGNVLTLNGVPVGGGGGGGVTAVTGTAPIVIGGTADIPNVSINLSGIVQTAGAQTITGGKKFATFPVSEIGALPGANNEFANKLYVDNTIQTWSQYPATQDVNMNLYKIANCTEIANNTTGYGLTITSDQDIAIEASTGNLDITASAMTIHNALSMDNNKITNVANPTQPTDVATKEYVDNAPHPVPTLDQVMTIGNSAGGNNLNMNSNNISNVANISMVGSVPTISAPLSATLTVAGLGPTTIASGTITTITAPTYVSIGSAGYTTIENLHIDNSVITKEAGKPDLQIGNVSAITNGATDMIIGNNQVQVKALGGVTVDSQNQTLTLQSGTGSINLNGTTAISGTNVSITTTGTTIIDNSVSGVAPISLQTGTTQNVCIQAGNAPSSTLGDSSILNVSSDSKGIYIPRLTTTQREAITNPQNGLMVYDTTDADLYIYGPRGWAKVTLTNSANQLLQSLSGLDGGVRTRSLTGFARVETGNLAVNTIEPLEPLVIPYVGIGADVSMPGNSSLSFGLVGGGDGTISVPDGTLNLNADTLSITTTNPIAIGSDVTFNGVVDFTEAIKLNGAFGPSGYVLVSNGSSLPASWVPFVGAPVSGRLTLGAISGDTIVPASNLDWDTTTGVLV